MSGGFYLSTVGKLLDWAKAKSLWYVGVGSGCCADEVLNTFGSRYDLERFGCVPQSDPRQADLLIVSGAISYKAAPFLRSIYDEMPFPKYVLAVGACANSGGAYPPELSYSIVAGVNRILPVDVYVPGCPPRPEAIMNGVIELQRKILGTKQVDSASQ